MTTNRRRAVSLYAKPQTVKRTGAAPAAVRLLKAPKAAPAQELIAQLAYEIWIAQGRPWGCDRQHWFEAEMQLQR